MKAIFKTIFTAGLVLFMCSLYAQSEDLMPITTDSKMAEELYQEAVQAAWGSDFKKAEEKLEDAVKEDPEFFSGYAMLAMLQSGNDEKADEFKANAAKAMEKADPDKLNDNEEIMADALKKMVEEEKPDLSAHGDQLAKLHPDNIEANMLDGWFSMGAGKVDDALAAFEKAAQLDPDFGAAHNLSGYANMQKGDMEKAKASFEKYIEVAPDNPNPYDSMGDYYMAIKDYEKAKNFYAEAGTKDPNWTASQPKHDEADKLLNEDPDNSTKPTKEGDGGKE